MSGPPRALARRLFLEGSTPMFRSLSRILAEIGGFRNGSAKLRAPPGWASKSSENRWVPSTIAGHVFNDAAGTGAFPVRDPIRSTPASRSRCSTPRARRSRRPPPTTPATTPSPSIRRSTRRRLPRSRTSRSAPPRPTRSETQQVTQFDSSLGTLTSVEIDMTGNVSSVLKTGQSGSQNTDAAGHDPGDRGAAGARRQRADRQRPGRRQRHDR